MDKKWLGLVGSALAVTLLVGCGDNTTSTSKVVSVKVDAKDYDAKKTKKKTYYDTKRVKTGTETKSVKTGTKTSTYRSGGKTKTKNTPVYTKMKVPVYKTEKIKKSKMVTTPAEYDIEVSYKDVEKDFEGVSKSMYDSVRVGSTMHARLTTVKDEKGKVVEETLSDLER